MSFKEEKTVKLSPDINETEYRALSHLGSTDISMILNNAYQFNLLKTGQIQTAKSCFEFGKAFHVALLEPEKYKDLVQIVSKVSESLMNLALSDEAPRNNVLLVECKSKSTNIYKNAVKNNPSKRVLIRPEFEVYQNYKENRGKSFITYNEHQLIHDMILKCREIPNFINQLNESTTEQAYFGEIDGVPVKCRIDILSTYKGIVNVIDPKTTEAAATEQTFIKSSGANNYFIQEALYTEILRQNGINVDGYSFLLVSKDQYSGAGYYSHAQVFKNQGMDYVHKAIAKYKYCKENNIWSENKFNFHENKFEFVSEVLLPIYVFYKYE